MKAPVEVAASSWIVSVARPLALPCSVVAPEPETSVRFFEPPASVEANRISPAPVPVFTATAPVRVVGLLNDTASLVVLMLPAVLIVEPVSDTAPPEVITPAAAMFRLPVALAVTRPLVAVVVMAALTAITPPVRRLRLPKVPVVTDCDTVTPPVFAEVPTTSVPAVMSACSACEMPTMPAVSFPPRSTTVAAL